MAAFSFADWFVAWRKALGNPARFAHGAEWQLDLRHLVVSALSDASAEQLLNPLVASHLRHYGARWAIENGYQDKTFWVRSEWAKVDLSYGLAEPFDRNLLSWNRAWLDGKTGDLGQCEVKVLYAHEYESKVKAKLKNLVEQLEKHREVDRLEQEKAPHVLRHLKNQRYHGIIWMFEHQRDRKPTRKHDYSQPLSSLRIQEWLPRELKQVHAPQMPLKYDTLIRTWPDVDGKPYEARLDLALVKLK